MSLVKSFALIFGFMHIAASLLGLRIIGLSPWVSVALMLTFSLLCFSALIPLRAAIRVFLAWGWSIGVMVEWLHIIQWSPAFTEAQYIVMALLNMGMALCYASQCLDEK